jgi:hypothetical protein
MPTLLLSSQNSKFLYGNLDIWFGYSGAWQTDDFRIPAIFLREFFHIPKVQAFPDAGIDTGWISPFF